MKILNINQNEPLYTNFKEKLHFTWYALFKKMIQGELLLQSLNSEHHKFIEYKR
jgi:hypothetical protein